MEEGRYDEIKQTYTKHIKDNLKSPLSILKTVKEQINVGIISNGMKNEIHKGDVFDFIKKASGDVLYCDSPYAGTLSYEGEYAVLDRILGENIVKSRFCRESSERYQK